jgi:hypothetical protein
MAILSSAPSFLAERIVTAGSFSVRSASHRSLATAPELKAIEARSAKAKTRRLRQTALCVRSEGIAFNSVS